MPGELDLGDGLEVQSAFEFPSNRTGEANDRDRQHRHQKCGNKLGAVKPAREQRNYGHSARHGQNGERQDSRGGRIVVAAVGDALAPNEIRIKTAADKVRQDRGKGDGGDKESVDMWPEQPSKNEHVSEADEDAESIARA